ncbi:SDR family NAD(P)-dependent oxidoreductase, partial [Xanthomonas hortorum pv. gardneri]|uniref:SDR family NAD(P)-dependent oxidoreductase n=1 Tax=Xanthomonas hortorum TaxID=56454 RepID=UPI003ED97462
MQPSSVLAIVTGGVSGLGLAVAQRIVTDGGKVALFDVNADKAEAALALLGAGNAHYFATDVTDEAQFTARLSPPSACAD